MCVLYFRGSCELTEAALLKEVIFAFQGITGNYIYYDTARECFAVDPKVRNRVLCFLFITSVCNISLFYQFFCIKINTSLFAVLL